MQERIRAFTLVEIMVVLMVILVIASIGIPNLIRSRQSANAANAATSCLTICNACNVYLSDENIFPRNLSDLIAENPPYMDPNLANATTPETALHGYYYTYRPREDNLAFILIAKPVDSNAGKRQFLVDETCFIHYYDGFSREVEITDPAL